MDNRPNSIRQRLDRLWREGRIAWSGKPFRPKRPRAKARRGTVAELIREDRR